MATNTELVRRACLLGLLAVPSAWSQSGFAVLSHEPGSWPAILASVGFEPRPPAEAGIFVLRPGSSGSPQWDERVRQGAFLILEGESSLAGSFGFRPGEERIRAASVEEARLPELSIVWQKPLELPRFELPAGARIFARERWTGAPLLAGFPRGQGAVLWVAADPGERGYERFPYLIHALRDLGLDPPFRSARLWAFFDYGHRARVDPEYFAPRWRSAGIAALHVSAWHFFEPDPERDAYLRQLIEACHRHGVLVYAWLELPHVSEEFWRRRPECREKTALLQDAHLDWRKLINLLDRDCSGAVQSGVKDLIIRFDWDGVNLAELYFESLRGLEAPARFTPMNGRFRELFRRQAGFDPIEIFGARRDPESARKVLEFRAETAARLQEEWLAALDLLRRAKPHLDLVLTHIDDRFDARMKDALGADSARMLPLAQRYDFTFLVEDPATVWHLGPSRYTEIARRYQRSSSSAGRLGIDINIVERYQDVYPTRQQTGTELLQQIRHAASAFPRVALYFEKSILAPDLPLLSPAAAVVGKAERLRNGLLVDSPHGVGVPSTGPVLVNGKPWPVADESVVWLPAGSHYIEAARAWPPVRVLDFNGELLSAAVSGGGAVALTYKSSSRALARISRKPARLLINGMEAVLETAGPGAVLLPRGANVAVIRAE